MGGNLVAHVRQMWSGRESDGSYRDDLYAPPASIPIGIAVTTAGAIGLLLTLSMEYTLAMLVGLCWAGLGYRSLRIARRSSGQ
jgi:hypothetical protein